MENTVEDFLEHFGVKGMKWGVRREGGAVQLNTKAETVTVVAPRKKAGVTDFAQRKYEKQNADTAVTVVQRPGQKLATKGGSNRAASEDAIKAATARRIAKSSSVDALSTKELQELVTRMNLEQQYSKIVNPPKKDGIIQGLIKASLGIPQQVVATQGAAVGNEFAKQQLIKKGLLPAKGNGNNNSNN